MYESSSERWSPVQSIEKILLSGELVPASPFLCLDKENAHGKASPAGRITMPVLSMPAEPNVESGANIDACKLWRDDRKSYEAKIRDDVRKSLGL